MSEAEAPRHRRSHPIALSLALSIALVVLAVTIWPRQTAKTYWCEGIGLAGPVAATSRGALAAWLSGPAAGTQPDLTKWRLRHGPGEVPGGVYYDNTLKPLGNAGAGYHSISVIHEQAGWSVDGACV